MAELGSQEAALVCPDCCVAGPEMIVPKGEPLVQRFEIVSVGWDIERLGRD